MKMKNSLLMIAWLFFIYLNILNCNYLFADYNKQTVKIDMSREFLSHNYIFPPNNEWIIFLPAELNKQALFTAINLVNGKYLCIEAQENVSSQEIPSWKYVWKNNYQAILLFEQGAQYVYFLLEINNSTISINKIENYSDKELKLTSTIISRQKYDLGFYRDLGHLKIEHPEIVFEEKGGKLNVIYNGSLISQYSPITSNELPHFAFISFSPDNSYAFYVIVWFVKGGWGRGTYYLYLLDLKNKKTALIDDKYDYDTPEVRFWTDDSKKFIHMTGVEDWAYILFNIISFNTSQD